MERCAEAKEEGLNLEILSSLCQCSVKFTAACTSPLTCHPWVLLLLLNNTSHLKIPATMAVGHNVDGELINTEVAAVIWDCRKQVEGREVGLWFSNAERPSSRRLLLLVMPGGLAIAARRGSLAAVAHWWAGSWTKTVWSTTSCCIQGPVTRCCRDLHGTHPCGLLLCCWNYKLR